MATGLLDALLRCSHEFSWPRKGAEGEYYQVCLICGTEYGYDWSRMRRTKQLRHREEQGTGGVARSQARSHSHRKATWKPRARRLAADLPVEFRQPDMELHPGAIRNISKSGVLVHASHMFPPDTEVELIFEMPEDISGQPHSRVLCFGKVVRASAGHDHKAWSLAVSISGYKFLH